MDIRKKQLVSLFFWRRYSVTFDRINRNALNKEFAIKNKDIPLFTDRSKQWRYISREILRDEPIDYLEFGVFRGDSIRE